MWGFTRTRQLHINAMKSLFSLLAIVSALLVAELAFVSGETFTEGVRVSPDTVTLKPGEYDDYAGVEEP